MKKYKKIYLVYNQKLNSEEDNVFPMCYPDIFQAERSIESMPYNKDDYVIVEVSIPVEYPNVEETLTAKEVNN